MCQGDFQTAVERLLPLRNSWHLLGGSEAQLEVFDDTLINAAAEVCLALAHPHVFHSQQAGAFGLTRNILSERCVMMNSSFCMLTPNVNRLCHRMSDATKWYQYASICDTLGQHGEALKARERAYAVGEFK